VDTVARWEASRKLKDAVDASLAELIRTIEETGRPEQAARIFCERLERGMDQSGLPIGVAMKEAFGGKNIDFILEALEASGFPLDAIAEVRAGLGRSAKRPTPASEDLAAMLARVPAIPLPEHFEDAATALARVPAIPLPACWEAAGELPPAVEAPAPTPEGATPTTQTARATVATNGPPRASEVRRDADEVEGATMLSVARSATAIGIALADADLRMAARVVDYLRVHGAGWARGRARFRAPIHARPRAARAPRRAAHRSAVAPARDGPPPSDDAPPPLASRSLLVAIGGSR
jgi:hypothetical protein